MCGVTGFWDFKDTFSKEEAMRIGTAMALRLRHRGPDSSGVWCDAQTGLVLGLQRLSIIDLSAAGHQPMLSMSGRSVIAYNGEVYNANAIRKKLSALGIKFRGLSDTEVVLEACEHWGVEAAVSQFIGMFAFAFWSRHEKKLYLVRDRVGIKPMYFGFQKNILFFGSELKSFFPHPQWRPEIDRDALVSYFRYSYIPSPQSIYKNIYKLQPGCIAIIDEKLQVKDVRYWSLYNIVSERSEAEKRNEDDFLLELDGLLQDAVKCRMISDVPLGAFLSGGVDSSIVIALMQSQSQRPVKTFTIGFSESQYNEAPQAKRVAEYLKTEHHELYVCPQDAIDVIPSLAEWYDEPFADSSQIPTYLVSKLAREYVTVSLSGDGGDELFAGYTRYLASNTFWKRLGWLPITMRRAIAKGINLVPSTQWSQVIKMIPTRFRPSNITEKIDKLATMLRSEPHSFYQPMMSMWPDPMRLVANGSETYHWSELPPHYSLIEKMQYVDMNSYLPDDILTKVDRASMSVGLEARVPLLDHRVVELAWRMPLSMKARGHVGKWALRQILNRYLPADLIRRPKMGFGIPIDLWLRGPLRSWADDLLSQKSLDAHGILNVDLIQSRWKAHCEGRRNFRYSIWPVLMFQAWYQHWVR